MASGLVRFYACEGDPLQVVVRLVAKAREHQQTVQVSAESDILRRISALLWEEPGFLAHASLGAPERVVRRSPVWLSEDSEDHAAVDVRINVGNAVDCSRSQASKVFEVVGPQPEERAAGRERFRRHEAHRGVRPDHVKVPA